MIVSSDPPCPLSEQWPCQNILATSSMKEDWLERRNAPKTRNQTRPSPFLLQAKYEEWLNFGMWGMPGQSLATERKNIWLRQGKPSSWLRVFWGGNKRWGASGHRQVGKWRRVSHYRQSTEASLNMENGQFASPLEILQPWTKHCFNADSKCIIHASYMYRLNVSTNEALNTQFWEFENQ